MSGEDWTHSFFENGYLATKALTISPLMTSRECNLIERELCLRPGLAVLDLACGHGRHAIEFTRRGYGPVTGIDFSSEAIAWANRSASPNVVRPVFVQQDMRTLNCEGKFDAVYNAYNSMFYWDDTVHLDILKRVLRALKPGGVFFIDFFNRELAVAKIVFASHRLVGPIQKIRSSVKFLSRKILSGVKMQGGAKYLGQELSSFDMERGILKGTKIIGDSEGDKETRHLEMRLYAMTEVLQLLRTAGFCVDRLMSSPDGGNMRLTSHRLAVLARKPS